MIQAIFAHPIGKHLHNRIQITHPRGEDDQIGGLPGSPGLRHISRQVGDIEQIPTGHILGNEAGHPVLGILNKIEIEIQVQGDSAEDRYQDLGVRRCSEGQKDCIASKKYCTGIDAIK